MNIGFISTRLAGTDGVSLEVERWSRVLRGMTHDIFFCAGELGGCASGGALIPELYFQDERIQSLTARAFDLAMSNPSNILQDIRLVADEIREPLRNFIVSPRLDLIIVQNPFAIPMNLPLGCCLAQLIAELGIDAIADNHDFYWKREPFILQPTLVIRRIGIELALILVQSLSLRKPSLFITDADSDQGREYWLWLAREAEVLGVHLRKVDCIVRSERSNTGSRKFNALWDIYPHADRVTCASLYEGFGNALLEAIYFRRPIVANRYPVNNADIKPLGFEFIEINGFVSPDAVQIAGEAISDPASFLSVTKKTTQLAENTFHSKSWNENYENY